MALEIRDEPEDIPKEQKVVEEPAADSSEPTPEEQEEHLKERDEKVAQTAQESAQAHQEEPPPTSPNVAHKQDKTHGVHGGPTDPDAAGRYQAWFDMRWTPEFLAEGDDKEGYKKFLEGRGIPGGMTEPPVPFDKPLSQQQAQPGVKENAALPETTGKTGTYTEA
jgi:hypothetical protein